MGKEKFKIGDMVRHKNGGLTYEVIGTAYDLGWISLRGKLPFGGAEPFPCTNYDEYEIVPKHVVPSLAFKTEFTGTFVHHLKLKILTGLAD